MDRNVVRIALLSLIFSAVTGCVREDKRHRILISVPDQTMMVLQDGKPLAIYPISTSKFGLGDGRNTNQTPLGEMRIKKKIGEALPSGGVLKGRKFTGEVLAVNAPGRDPIVTRILWLEGLEPQNKQAYSRFIYIHGTPEEVNIGKPASFGCIRMRSRDVIELYDLVGYGARVNVTPNHLIIPPQFSTAPQPPAAPTF